MKKKIVLVLFTVLILSVCIFPSFASETHPPRIVDAYGLLSEDDYAELTELYDEISIKQNVDVVLVIIDTVGDSDYSSFADDYFDYNGYGMGEDFDGILFLYSVDDAYTYISTHGIGISAVTDENEDAIFDAINPKIKEGSYLSAFTTFARMCDDYITEATTFDLPMNLLISLAVGFIIALIVTGIMKGKLKSVKFQRAASNYLKPGSLNIYDSREMFLYRQITRTKKQENSSNSNTHTSSSGRTHGGGGRSL